ncbi:MAG: cytochrome ubiquinol oxidase subunit I [Vulcanimicrobiaceae bacterium]|jgi:cytochrome d ubiquinol oxidase subunit I
MDIVTVDRLQFAFTVMFHYLFPIGTLGIAPFIAWYVYRASTGDAEADSIARFLTKIFAFNFAAGVVTGIPMEFQFGTNWATFSAKSGSVIGQPLAMEGVYAFFLESVFLGVLLYGKKRVSPRWYIASAVCVWIGSWISGYFIVATNAWMQHPVGYHVTNGTIELDSIAAVLFSSFAWWQFAHVIVSAALAGGFILAGIGSYYVLARRDESIGRRFTRAGVIVAFIASCLVIFPTGDRNGHDVTINQPIKLAAMEGLFETTHGAPLAIIGMPDVANKKLIDPIVVPRFLSFLAYGNFDANVDGLTNYATVLWPPVELTYYAYHVMVGFGTIFLAASALAVLLLLLKRLEGTRGMLWALMLLMPFPYIAIEAGWVTSEVGRQPWIIYGVMRTSEGVSANVNSGEVLFTLIGFLGMYFMLGVTFLYLVLREIGLGPAHE